MKPIVFCNNFEIYLIEFKDFYETLLNFFILHLLK